MASLPIFSVREYPKSPRTDLKDFFRVYIKPATMTSLGVRPADPCNLNLSDGSARAVFVHPANDPNLKDSVIQIPRQLQYFYEIKLSDKPTLSKSNIKLADSSDIALCEVPTGEFSTHPLGLEGDERSHWAWLLEYNLWRAEILSPGLVFGNIEAKGQKRTFKIQKINGSSEISLYRFQPSCTVRLVDEETKGKELRIEQEEMGGLDNQIMELNAEFATYGNVNRSNRLPNWCPQTTNGILLHGAPGTGKSLLLQQIGKAGWQGVFNLDMEHFSNPRNTENAAAIQKVFADARKYQPSVIILDDLEQFVGNGRSSSSGVSHILCKEIERLGDSRTVVVAATHLLSNIDPKLRNVQRFSFVLEIPVPTVAPRAEILKALSGLPKHEPNASLDTLAIRTHNYVGADLAMLLYQGAKKAKARINASGSDKVLVHQLSPISIMERISPTEFESALREVRPTAMREISVETPNVRWNDIGGQEETKKNLERALIWPSKYENEMKQLGIIPRKGLLLYGPPGCSKTMIAQAAATESGHSFIAVKGADMLNMYVGESERRVRDLFRLARSVSPSIIFFDEIDAIGTARGGDQHAGLNVVTTLLNELDGIEELKGVFVLAATNRPDVIDPALIRAGRLDKMLYVGPPNMEARKHIIGQQLRNMEVADDLDDLALVKTTDGFSGAELVNLCKEAAEAALEDNILRQKLPKVGREHFDRVLKTFCKVITPEMIEFFEKFEAGSHS